ncbi:MAG: tetratricopeptide repeat-containing sulfotransferase family protein [Planctomycetota bacterium]|jgi:tetratricopeptide (TPR) repeat protein
MNANDANLMQDEGIATKASELHEQGLYHEAIGLYKELLLRHESNGQIHARIGAAYLSVGEYGQARACLETALSLEPSDTDTIVQLARATFLNGDPDLASEHLERALAIDPDSNPALLCKAEFALLQKDYANACELLVDEASRDDCDVAVVLTCARALMRAGRKDESIEMLTRHLDRDDVNKKNRRRLASRLASVLDKEERYDEAFHWIMVANESPRHSQQMSLLQSMMTDVCASVTPERLAAVPRSTVTDPAPVFVVGMPRAGTTLLEHTVAAHPKGHGMGELMSLGMIADRLYGWHNPGIARIDRMRMVKPASLEREATQHLAMLRAHAGDAERVVDKMPSNFFILPVIMQLFPNARILHARRSPRDTCLSCLFNLDPYGHWYSTHLDELGIFYNQYDRLMAHFKRVVPMPILDVQYERMVLDRRSMVAEILEFLDLPWDDACVRQEKEQRSVYTGSYEQAQQAIYTTSLQRWKNYESHLGPLLDHLQVREPDVSDLLSAPGESQP